MINLFVHYIDDRQKERKEDDMKECDVLAQLCFT